MYFVNHFPILITIVPVFFALLNVIFPKKNYTVSWFLALSAGIINIILVSNIIFFFNFKDSSPIKYNLGGWENNVGIEFIVNNVSALVLFAISLTMVNVLLYSYKNVDLLFTSSTKKSYFFACLLLCLSGFIGMVISNDIFNLYVFLEIASVSVYALIALEQKKKDKTLNNAFDYLSVGTIASSFYLFGTGILYWLTGTLNMEVMSKKLLLIDAKLEPLLFIGTLFILVALLIKSGLAPMHIWIVKAYEYAHEIVAIFLIGVATKVFIWLIIKFKFFIIPSFSFIHSNTLNFFISYIAVFAILFCTMKSIFEKKINNILLYSSFAQIGYIILAITTNTQNSIISVIIILINDAVIKPALLIASDVISSVSHTRNLKDILHYKIKLPKVILISVNILLLSLVSLPFTGGFIGKFLLLSSLISEGKYFLSSIIILTYFLSMFYVFNILESINFSTFQQKDTRTHNCDSVILYSRYTMLFAYIPILLSLFYTIIIGTVLPTYLYRIIHVIISSDFFS